MSARSVRVVPADPRAPAPKDSRAWEMLPALLHDGETINRWRNGTVMACSSRHGAMESKRTGLIVPQLHVSISDDGARASDETIRGVLADFGFEGAEEDNHQPGIARHFWLDEGARVQPECECKKVEETVTEPDGFKWQRPR